MDIRMGYPFPSLKSSPLRRQGNWKELSEIVCVGVVERPMMMRGQVLSGKCSRPWLSRNPRVGGGDNVGGIVLALASNPQPS